MRTPWKMLADLVSGKSSKDETETEPQARADEATPLVADANNTVASADGSPAPVKDAIAASPVTEIASGPDVVANPETVDDAGTVTATTTIDEPVSFEKKAELASPSAASEDPDKPATPPRVVKAPVPIKTKRSVIKQLREAKSLPTVELSQEIKPAPTAHPNEMADLDRDIKVLRKQLAEKLKLQNAQLRKLINRYAS